MKVSEITAWLFHHGEGADYKNTCDTLKAGSEDAEVTRLAVAMFGSAKVFRDAVDWGAQMLLVHEPIYYTHYDRIPEEDTDPVIAAKQVLVRESGMTVVRFHDHAHHHTPDVICEGELAAIGLPGRFEKGPYYAVNRYTLDTPMTAAALAAHLEKALSIGHIRVIGNADTPFTRLSCCFGTPGHLRDEMKNGREIILAGEIDEWSDGEYFRDAAALGFPAAVLVMGHIGSERDGMKLTAERLGTHFPALSVRYFECGEVYGYPETAGK